MIIETRLKFNKYLQIMFILTYRKPIMVFLTFVGLIMFVGSICYFLGVNIPIDTPPYFQLFLGFGIIILLPFSIYVSAKNNFTTYSILQEKIVYEFTEHQIKISGETFHSDFSWEKIYKVCVLKNWILIYQNRILAHIIPKESFGASFEEFNQLIKNKPKIKNNFSIFKKIMRILIISICVIPFILFGILYFFSKAEPEEIIIPKNYQGEILIFFDQKIGETIKYIDRKRVYEIPDNGILFTQFKWNPGFNNRKFCFLIDGKKHYIDGLMKNYSFVQGKSDSDVVSVINKGPYYYKSADGKNYLFRADQFIIAKRKYLNNYSVETKIDSIIDAKFSRSLE